jgi:hypothetical protein
MFEGFYLDSPTEERATGAILSQIGIVFSSGEVKVEDGRTFELASREELTLEHKRDAVVRLMVLSGQIYLDVRDSAGCWIRVCLKAHEGAISLPANLYRKFSAIGSASLVEVESPSPNKVLLRYAEESDAIEVISYHTYRELVCELCRQFFIAGWVTGTGGSISIRHGNRIYMTPSGVQKERILPDELFVLDIQGEILSAPSRKPGCRAPKLSDCSPLFLHAFQQRNAGKKKVYFFIPFLIYLLVWLFFVIALLKAYAF